MLQNRQEILLQEDACPPPYIKEVLEFLERYSTILNSITLQNVIKSAEKTNAQCISNETFLITMLQMLYFSRNNTNWFLLITII